MYRHCMLNDSNSPAFSLTRVCTTEATTRIIRWFLPGTAAPSTDYIMSHALKKQKCADNNIRFGPVTDTAWVGVLLLRGV